MKKLELFNIFFFVKSLTFLNFISFLKNDNFIYSLFIFAFINALNKNDNHLIIICLKKV